ncbi:MAG: TlpA family protein disulfide reductase [Clostridiales bacterium]|jgi:peroxiredoxin|nr:TlpA family protein disulfide reductase [Clostridiales bacterium]
MKKLGIILVLILTLVLSSCSIGKKSDTTPEEGEKSNVKQELKVGEKVKAAAPDFELDTLNGNKVKLSDLKGKTVVINFFATWCPPCRAEMPGFISTMEEYTKNNKNVAFLFVDVDEDDATLEEFLKERNYTIDPLMDKGGAVYSEYTLRGGIPTTTIVDADGNISAQHEGLMESSDLKAYIEEALKK